MYKPNIEIKMGKMSVVYINQKGTTLTGVQYSDVELCYCNIDMQASNNTSGAATTLTGQNMTGMTHVQAQH